MLLEGFRAHDVPRIMATDVLASMMAWAVCGAASAWVIAPDRCSIEEVAAAIDRLLVPMLVASESPV